MQTAEKITVVLLQLIFFSALLIINTVSISVLSRKVCFYCKCPGEKGFCKYPQHQLPKLKKQWKSPSKSCFLKINSGLTFSGSSIHACKCAETHLMEMSFWILREPHRRATTHSIIIAQLQSSSLQGSNHSGSTKY